MARSRNIKPGFFKNEILGAADPLLSLLFSGLWIHADRKGILEDRPLRIKAEIFPYREKLDINRYLTELERFDFIHRYEVDGIKLIQIKNFNKHQNPHHTEKDSIYPDYSCNCEDKNTKPLNNGCAPADSLNTDSLNTDSLNTDSLNKPKDGYSDDFENVWHEYPKRPGSNKKEAYKVWNARLKSGVSVATMADGVIRYAEYCKVNKTEPNYIKLPSTFFGPSEHYLSDWKTNGKQISRQDSLKRTGDILTGRARQDDIVTIDVD